MAQSNVFQAQNYWNQENIEKVQSMGAKLVQVPRSQLQSSNTSQLQPSNTSVLTAVVT